MTASVETHVIERPFTVAIVGNPNTGKSTVFNALTGFRQHVANYPGVTVEKRTGRLRHVEAARPIELIDLPGMYSLAAGSEDEAVALDVLLGESRGTRRPDAVVVVVDATHLRRNLFLVGQVLELEVPVVVALNMVDLAANAGIEIDVGALAKALTVPVLPIVATRSTGIDDLIRAISQASKSGPPDHRTEFPPHVREQLDGLESSIASMLDGSGTGVRRVTAMQALLYPGGNCERRLVERCGPAVADELAERRGKIEAADETIAEIEGRVRYAWSSEVVAKVVTRTRTLTRSRTETADRFLTHRVTGLLVFLVLLGIVFQSVYTWAGPLMNLIETAFGGLGALIAAAIPAGPLRSLLVDGAIAGVGGILVFLPQILILFMFIAILEDCGYMSRAALLMDRYMRAIGLNGKAVIPLLSSFACAVPGIMAARTIEGRNDRLLTILLAPVMSCSARLPVYMLMIGAFVPAKPLLGGVVGLQAMVLLAMYALGIVVAIVVAWILKHTLLKGETSPFLMELPTYHWPSPKTVLYRMYEQGREFCVQAGTIIFAVAIVVWALGYYPRPASIAQAHDALRSEAASAHSTDLLHIATTLDPDLTAEELPERAAVAGALRDIETVEASFAVELESDALEPGSTEWQTLRHSADIEIERIVRLAGSAGIAARSLFEANANYNDRLSEIGGIESGVYLRNSYLGRMGRFIEPAVRPLGWDWRVGMAAIASFPAREVVIATLGTIYNLSDVSDEQSAALRTKLQNATWPDGRKVFDAAVALSIMVFFALCCQCVSTLAIMRRETNSWRWPIFTFVWMTGLAYVGALVTYQVAVRFV
ncbi:MAG: ferrous iron transport protein B [Planctomycetes bacterium]|nr:ferrous iron transport protein B [Planctomycetota bacterium]